MPSFHQLIFAGGLLELESQISLARMPGTRFLGATLILTVSGGTRWTDNNNEASFPNLDIAEILTVHAQGFGGKQWNLYSCILHLTLVDGIVVRCIHQQRQLRDNLVVRHLGDGVHALVVLVPLQIGRRIAASRAALQLQYGARDEYVAIVVARQQRQRRRICIGKKQLLQGTARKNSKFSNLHSTLTVCDPTTFWESSALSAWQTVMKVRL